MLTPLPNCYAKAPLCLFRMQKHLPISESQKGVFWQKAIPEQYLTTPPGSWPAS
jgi:hypothetical protein